MSGLSAIGVVAALVAAGGLVAALRPLLPVRMLLPSLVSAVLAAALTIGVGIAGRVAAPEYLIGIAAFGLPIVILLQAAAIISGADVVGRWIVPLAWGAVVFPLAALVPLALTAGCAGTDCELEDFGGVLPLIVSAAAFVLLARLPARVIDRPTSDSNSTGRIAVALLVVWAASGIWLVQLEGAIDEFTPRIVSAVLVVPLAAGATWLLADRARGIPRPVLRSLTWGVMAGLVTVLPLAVTVAFPWTVAVGGLAGALGSLTASSRGAASVGPAARWGGAVLVAAAVGLLAPAISGDDIGLLFIAHVGVLVPPIAGFLGVAAASIAISVPVWVLVWRRADQLKWAIPDSNR